MHLTLVLSDVTKTFNFQRTNSSGTIKTHAWYINSSVISLKSQWVIHLPLQLLLSVDGFFNKQSSTGTYKSRDTEIISRLIIMQQKLCVSYCGHTVRAVELFRFYLLLIYSNWFKFDLGNLGGFRTNIMLTNFDLRSLWMAMSFFHASVVKFEFYKRILDKVCLLTSKGYNIFNGINDICNATLVSIMLTVLLNFFIYL